MPGWTKHAINSRFIFFAISRRYHLKWLSSYVNHISGYELPLNETMSCPFFQIVMLFCSQVLPCESNLCTQIRFTKKHSAIKKDTYFGKKGRLMISFNVSTYPDILLT